MMGDCVAAGVWAARLNRPDGTMRASLRRVYGEDDVCQARLELLRAVVAKFLERYGDTPVRLFRSPGRINLRGMHVDTHGGYLNLMTHQRETVVAAAPRDDDRCTFAHAGAGYSDVEIDLSDCARLLDGYTDWRAFVFSDAVRAHVRQSASHWGNYLTGAICRALFSFPERPLRGVRAVVGGDIPAGASLSSSASLCVSVLLALCGTNDCALGDAALITCARDAEWFTGSRCGLSDQAAMVLPERGELINVSLGLGGCDLSDVRRARFPEALRVLAIDSYTERSLSGAALAEYTRNRFAYSIALDAARHELCRDGFPDAFVDNLRGLAGLAPEVLAAQVPGYSVFRLLRHIPETIALAELRRRYDLPGLDAAYQQYFGGVPEDLRPDTIALRGPLLFGIAESERARTFFSALADGEYERAGHLMTIGHDGDRKVTANESGPYRAETGDDALDTWREAGTSIEDCPGAYGASSPVMDALVDVSLRAGALGASLTGAGIAGTVLALCRSEDAQRVVNAVRTFLASEAYLRLTGRNTPLRSDEVRAGCIINHATSRACELVLPGVPPSTAVRKCCQ